MKNLVKLVGATLTLASTAAMATPQYTGNTFGSGMDEVNPTVGYFLWNEESSPMDWKLRWTADDSFLPERVACVGEITFRDSTLGTVDTFFFEIGGIYGDTLNVNYSDLFADSFNFEAATNNSGGVDGIDFSIDGSIELLRVSLGSQLFDGLTLAPNDPGVASEMIYIGKDAEGTNVLVFENNGMTFQEFEIQVPEPQ